MNFKDYIFPLILAILTTLVVQRLFMHSVADQEPIRPGQSFRVSSADQMIKPLYTEIDFIDTGISENSEITPVQTPLVSAHFSTVGATLSSLTFKRVSGGVEAPLIPLQNQRAFLVALEQKTPLNYSLIDQAHEAGEHRLVYRTETDQCVITKTFTLFDALYKINCVITLEPKTGTVQPRLFFPSPHLGDVHVADVVQAVVYTDAHALKKMSLADVVEHAFAQPALFGTEDRYFVHALVADEGGFAQRGYFIRDGALLTTILEGPVISTPTTWELSFYCGPKETEPMAAVEIRLEDTLDYGWFAPLSKLLLTMLKWLYSVLHNYGLAIIILTLVMKLALAPFTIKGEKSMQKSADLRKKMQYIEQKYKHDSELLQHEKTELLRKHGFSDMAGCLPLLVQIPLFIGLNRVLTSSIELFKAPFLWIPDLSAKDPYFILPALIGCGMLIQSSTATDPRQRVAMMIMALVLIGVTANLVAGLTLFIVVSTLAAVVQTKLQKK